VEQDNHAMSERTRQRSFLTSPFGIALCVFLAVAALFLVLEHRAHLLGAWPLLFLLVCVVMHLFMHRGHGGHGSHGGDHGSHHGRKRGDNGQ
jgi:O-antigen/teichoic acid export membrane protein